MEHSAPQPQGYDQDRHGVAALGGARVPLALGRCLPFPPPITLRSFPLCFFSPSLSLPAPTCSLTLVPEQRLPGAGQLVSTWAWWSLPGHLLVDAPGSHTEPQHSRQGAVVQGHAHLRGQYSALEQWGPACPQDSRASPQEPAQELSSWAHLPRLPEVHRGGAGRMGTHGLCVFTLWLLMLVGSSWTVARTVTIHGT